MKILKRGTPPEKRPYQTTCRICKTEFEFEEREGSVVYDQRDGNYVQIKCPVCRHHCMVGLR